MLVVCFEFCLALPEVIHLPRGLEAVTRNWRNHDSTELSASTVPGWGIWRCTLQLQEVGTFFPLWVFYAIFFFLPILSISFLNIFLPSLPEHSRHLRIREYVYLDDKMTRKSQFCRDIEVVERRRRRRETFKNAYKFSGVGRQHFCRRRSKRAAATFSRPLTRKITREFQRACSAKAWEMKRVWWKTW